jgi:hypothetical protein
MENFCQWKNPRKDKSQRQHTFSFSCFLEDYLSPKILKRVKKQYL